MGELDVFHELGELNGLAELDRLDEKHELGELNELGS